MRLFHCIKFLNELLRALHAQKHTHTHPDAHTTLQVSAKYSKSFNILQQFHAIKSFQLNAHC